MNGGPGLGQTAVIAASCCVGHICMVSGGGGYSHMLLLHPVPTRVIGRGASGAAMAAPLFDLPVSFLINRSNAQQVFLKDCCRHS